MEILICAFAIGAMAVWEDVAMYRATGLSSADWIRWLSETLRRIGV